MLTYPLNVAGVERFNAARGDFFTLGGNGGGRGWLAYNGTLHRDPIFAGVTDPAKLVVTCALPTTKAQCKNGGWRNYGDRFKNQGSCVSFVATGGKKKS